MWLFYNDKALDFKNCLKFAIDHKNLDLDFIIHKGTTTETISFRFTVTSDIQKIFNYLQNLIIEGDIETVSGIDLKKILEDLNKS
jgi:hypothetical protein